MTQTEFIKYYCENSKLTEEQLNDLGLFAIPCDCGDDDCKGWAMITRINVVVHALTCIKTKDKVGIKNDNS